MSLHEACRSQIRHVGVRWGMSVSDEAFQGLWWVSDQACQSPNGLRKVSDGPPIIILFLWTRIRIISNAKYNAHIKPLFFKLKILPLVDLILHQNLSFMHSIEYGYVPTSFYIDPMFSKIPVLKTIFIPCKTLVIPIFLVLKIILSTNFLYILFLSLGII